MKMGMALIPSPPYIVVFLDPTYECPNFPRTDLKPPTTIENRLNGLGSA
ncbi:hypothetical protein PHIM7_249 [Sinorhizobium phage phiM7]|uniref:Uncharacterized protein n=1 Tax=Sinorhizobium phage phiM7 TaxID=1647403 RepID=A0A0F6YQN0_9CAUD|nr:hypothetical protein FDH46_gp229 [Sinorhizobium phage phiM7]AKF12794.1 hypothetical protein PHIM7_249 [Sinorhizobium phage phiM7]AKF13155.1 hypothetical protein PHIM19_250 [Sinorhizobium phage phiM19]